MEGKISYGRTDALCDSAQRRESITSLCRELGYPVLRDTRSWSVLSIAVWKG
jgi:hypothetical protein